MLLDLTPDCPSLAPVHRVQVNLGRASRALFLAVEVQAAYETLMARVLYLPGLLVLYCTAVGLMNKISDIYSTMYGLFCLHTYLGDSKSHNFWIS